LVADIAGGNVPSGPAAGDAQVGRGRPRLGLRNLLQRGRRPVRLERQAVGNAQVLAGQAKTSSHPRQAVERKRELSQRRALCDRRPQRKPPRCQVNRSLFFACAIPVGQKINAIPVST
jgi:hypothetical protein